MSSSAFSKVVLGIKIDFCVEKFETSVQRFNPKDGKPFDLKSEAYHIDACCGGRKVRLPEDDQIFEEYEPDSWRAKNFNEWCELRLGHRTYEWFQTIGLIGKDDEEHEDPEGICVYGNHYNEREKIIGYLVASGGSYRHKERLVPISKRIDPDGLIIVKDLLAIKLQLVFGDIDYTPSMYLLTEQL